MKRIRSFLERVRAYLFPALDAELTATIDRQSMRNISHVSMAAFLFETLSILVHMTMQGWRVEEAGMAGLLSVSFCAVFSLIVFLISRRLMKQRNLPHAAFFAFKLVFFIVYTLWAIHVDMRHYTAGDQMLTFFTVQLMIVCFVLFRPWSSMLVTAGAYAGLYAAAVNARGAEGIDIFNFIILAVLSMVGMCVRYHTQIYLGRKEERLTHDAQMMGKYMRMDGLTGLQNRLALEEDAKKADGRPVTVYMTDINYFKEINDRYGHIAGDTILKETGNILRRLFPGALCYRYGGDEFLMICEAQSGNGFEDYVYRFDQQIPGGVCAVTLSVGSAAGEPGSYDEMFELISRADAALYEAKAKTHSPEHGGHERRHRR